MRNDEYDFDAAVNEFKCGICDETLTSEEAWDFGLCAECRAEYEQLELELDERT